ncbi:MAG: class I SAM-dependent methyltransferase [Clostridiales bacterium]|nr:class I SAM-dependent methyltransferase [Clostridiales bacterium]
MISSDKWKDYELIDCSDGRRLERWGKYILSRPDPQVIWKDQKKSPLWNKADAVYDREGGGGNWTKKDVPEYWTINYSNFTLKVKPMGFKHTGVFPEQAANWDFIQEKIREAKRPVKVLNLFAYTGAASIAAAAAGASVCHVDAAKGMVSQAKENAALSHLENAPIRYIVDDCNKFIEREIRRGNKYDGIIMDPPSYGRGPSGEVWKLEDNIGKFIESASKLLSDNPLFFIVNSYTTGLSPSSIGYLLNIALKGGKTECDELGLRVTQTGACLPCGGTARWTK